MGDTARSLPPTPQTSLRLNRLCHAGLVLLKRWGPTVQSTDREALSSKLLLLSHTLSPPQQTGNRETTKRSSRLEGHTEVHIPN